MALDVEDVVDGGVGRKKSLGRSSRTETLHPSFALRNRKMRIFCPVILPTTKIMVPGKAQILQDSTIRWKFVGDEGIGDEALCLQQFAYQFQRGIFVSPRMIQDIQHFALAIHCAPQTHALANDQHEHLIKMPAAARSRARRPQSSGIGLPKLQCPTPNSFVGNIDVAFSQQILDIPEAEWKSDLQPGRILDNLWWIPMFDVGNLCILRS